MDTKTKQIPQVLIGLPTMSSIHIMTATTIMSWLAQAYRSGEIGISLYPTICVQPVDNARNEIVEEFLAHPEYTHLFFIDSDTVPPQSALTRMLAHDKDIVTALTPIVESDDGYNFYRKWNVVGMDDKHVKPATGLIRAKGAGSSCILIKRKVFEALDKPHYRFEYKDDNGKPIIVSEDIRFTINAFAKGFEMWADTELICRHYKPAMW